MPKSENLVYWELVQVSVVACTGRTDTRDKLLQFYASSRLLLSSTVFWCSSRGTVTRWSNSTGILDEINHIIVSWLDVVMHILLAHVHSVELCIKFNAIMGAAQWLSTKAANPISRAAFVWSRCLQQPLEETDKNPRIPSNGNVNKHRSKQRSSRLGSRFPLRPWFCCPPKSLDFSRTV